MLAEMKRIEAAARVSMVNFADSAPSPRSPRSGLSFVWKPVTLLALTLAALLLALVVS